MHFRLFLTLAICLFAVTAAPPVMAQKMLPDTLEKKKDDPEDRWRKAREIFQELPSDMQEELEAEANLIYIQCTKQSIMSRYHDCACIGVRFLDERVLQGPDISQAKLQKDVQQYCVNDASIAGESYNSCMNMIPLNPRLSNRDPEAYCKCYANEMAEAYEDSPMMNSYYIQSIRGKVASTCSRKVPPIR